MQYIINKRKTVENETRMEFAGVNVGNRWEDVADHVAARGADTVSPFLTLQYLYALGRTGRYEAETLLHAIEARAEDTRRHDHAVWRDAGQRLAFWQRSVGPAHYSARQQGGKRRIPDTYLGAGRAWDCSEI